MSQKYYVQSTEHETGPFTLEEIHQMIREGNITKQTDIRTDNLTQATEMYPELLHLLLMQDPTDENTATKADAKNEPVQLPWQLATVMCVLRVYAWISAGLYFFSTTNGAESIYANISIELAVPISIAFFLVAITCKTHPAAALTLTTWLFFITLADNILYSLFGDEVRLEEGTATYILIAIGLLLFLLHLAFTVYYFVYKNKLPHELCSDEKAES